MRKALRQHRDPADHAELVGSGGLISQILHNRVVRFLRRLHDGWFRLASACEANGNRQGSLASVTLAQKVCRIRKRKEHVCTVVDN